MAQPSVAHYFNTRKRSAVDYKSDSAPKVLKLDSAAHSGLNQNELESNEAETNHSGEVKKTKQLCNGPTKIATLESQSTKRKIIKVCKTKNVPQKNKQDITTFISNMKMPVRCVTPPNPVQKEANNEPVNEIKKKLLKSSKLGELRASINNFKRASERLKIAEKRTNEIQKNSKQVNVQQTKNKNIAESPKLKTFKSIEFEVLVSPQKTLSPEKPYLSPKKEPSVRRNLLSALSPVKKNSTTLSFENCSKETLNDTKQGLKLPFKYRTLAEIFRAIDTVSQILYNRKEDITFLKLKPAVEEMLKRTLTQKHLAQIKFIYPDAYEYRQEKLKRFGMRQEEWHLVLTPNIGEAENMTSEVLLNRRRKLYAILVEMVKDYHNEFLLSLTPPMIISKDKITRWHPEFDLEKVPDIEQSSIPQAPVEHKFTSGMEVLEKARQMFNCNTRMEQALIKLRETREANPSAKEENANQPVSVLKGIPKALLEKVREKQAAKALVSMTISVDKAKEVQMYSRLPEIARLTRNLFVSEKKGVLELDTVVEKLTNSYRSFLTKSEIEEHLKAISIEVTGWLVFHKLRHSVFLKLAKNADLNVVLSKLEKRAKEKSELL